MSSPGSTETPSAFAVELLRMIHGIQPLLALPRSCSCGKRCHPKRVSRSGHGSEDIIHPGGGMGMAT